jgi:hypothetical protein
MVETQIFKKEGFFLLIVTTEQAKASNIAVNITEFCQQNFVNVNRYLWCSTYDLVCLWLQVKMFAR